MKKLLFLIILSMLVSFSVNAKIEIPIKIGNEVLKTVEIPIKIKEGVKIYKDNEVKYCEDNDELRCDSNGKPINGIALFQADYPIIYVTPYKNGEKDGIEKMYFDNDKKFVLAAETSYKKWKKDGEERVYHGNGKLQRKATYKNDEIEGIEQEFHENGKLKSVKHYKNGKEHGIEQVYTKKGKLLLENKWVNGTPDGIYKEIFISSFYDGSFFKDGLEQEKIFREAVYKNGKQHGYEKYFDKNGKVLHTNTWVNGTPKGHYKEYANSVFINGLIREATYKNGQLDGVEKEYKQDGSVKIERHYKKGEMLKEIKY